MAEITVTPSEDSYEVSGVEGSTSTSHSVTVGPEDLERFGRGATAPDLIEASIRFLLSKEPTESIRSSAWGLTKSKLRTVPSMCTGVSGSK